MSEPIRDVETAVREFGALPVPAGPEPQRLSVLDRARGALGARMAKDDLRLVLENVIVYAAGLESERHVTNESLSEAAEALRVQRDRIAELEKRPSRAEILRELAKQQEQIAETDAIRRRRNIATARRLFAGELRGEADVEDRKAEAAKCRCHEPDADPYACEADDCEGEFSELNPFGGGPVQGHDAKVSRTCGCGWRTTVWHVNDGSAEEELHRHVVGVHGGVCPEVSR